MNILVTGGAGFIGSNFCRWFLASEQGKNSNVTVYDALTYAGNLENLAGLEDSGRFHFVKGDIRNSELFSNTLSEQKIEYVLNFAAESHVDRSIHDPLSFVRTNIEGTQILLNCCKSSKIKRYLQISTDEVYGSLGPEGRFSESSPIQPSSPYSASKAGADLLVLAAYHTHKLDCVITRCSNNYGSYQFPEKLIPLFIINALENRELPLYGDGKNIRSWLHVDDHSDAILKVLLGGNVGEVYNIGGNPESEKDNHEVTVELLKILKKPSSLIKYITDRVGHDRRYAVDYSKIKKELNWEPTITFTDGLTSTIDWYIANKDWWERVRSGDYQKFYKLNYFNRS